MSGWYRPRELQKISAAGFTGRNTGLPYPNKWRKAGGPQPAPSAPRATAMTENTRSYFKSFVKSRG